MENDALEKYLGVALIVISVLVILFLVKLELQTLTEASAELALIAVGSLASIGLKFLLFPQKSILEKSPMFHWTDVRLIKSIITNEISDIPNLTYLHIHYSKRSDTADKPHRPYYVVNSKTKKAYWVHTELLVLNRRLIIDSNTHNGEKELKKYLRANGIELIDRNPEFGELS